MRRMPRASASERSARRVRAAVVALSIAGGLGLPAGTATGAVAETGTGGPGDGSLHLLPEVITNEGVSAGASAEFPIASRLFLAEVQERALQTKRSAAAVARAADKLAFEPGRSTSVSDAFATTRGRLFQDYSHQVIPSAARVSAAQDVDLWLFVLIGAAVPLTGLAAFLGLKMASRKASGHA